MNPFDPSFLRNAAALAIASAGLALAQAGHVDRMLWLLSRFDTVPAPGVGSISHCAKVEPLQRNLMSLRDSITGLGATGRRRRASCQDSGCLGSLQPLRDSLEALRGRESAARLALGQETSLCPAAVWSRWLRSRRIDSLLLSAPSLETTPEGSALALERAELAWEGDLERLLRGNEPLGSKPDPFVAKRFSDPSASCRWRLRRAFLLEWTGKRDSALRILEVMASEGRTCAREAAVARHWLGTEPSLPDSSRNLLLEGSLREPDLRSPSLLELSFLLAAKSRWSQAFDSLATALSNQPDLLTSGHVDSLARWADQAGFDPLARVGASPAPWLDRLQIARCRLLLASGRARKAQGLLADFRLRFPASTLGEEARELLARSRR